MKIQSVKDLVSIRQAYISKLYVPDTIKVNIGMASCGIAAGAQAAYDKILNEYTGKNSIHICRTGCIGFCEVEPMVEILGAGKPRVMYKNITKGKIIDAVEGYIASDFNKKWILGQMKDPRSLLEDDIDNPVLGIEPIDGIPILENIPFYSTQIKIAMRNCGYIDPDSIEEYFARKGYTAFLQQTCHIFAEPASNPAQHALEDFHFPRVFLLNQLVVF